MSGLPHKVQVFPSRRELLAPDDDLESVSCFVDASWGLNSVSGGIVTWNNCCLKTFSRKQTTVALSSAEAELAALTENRKRGIVYISVGADDGGGDAFRRGGRPMSVARVRGL